MRGGHGGQRERQYQCPHAILDRRVRAASCWTDLGESRFLSRETSPGARMRAPMTDAPDSRVPPAATERAGKPTKRPPRVNGPFEARRLGALEVPLRIHDMSIGGCLIESYHEAT